MGIKNPFDANIRGNESVGIGLGLNIVKRLCDKFSWKASIKTDKSTFCVILSTD